MSSSSCCCWSRFFYCLSCSFDLFVFGSQSLSSCLEEQEDRVVEEEVEGEEGPLLVFHWYVYILDLRIVTDSLVRFVNSKP